MVVFVQSVSLVNLQTVENVGHRLRPAHKAVKNGLQT
jgi:hypothetical protein